MKALAYLEHGKYALSEKPNAIATVVALCDEARTLPDMYGKNLVFKSGGVDSCDCAEILALIQADKIDTTPDHPPL